MNFQVHKVVLACKSKFFAKLYRHSPTVSEYTIDGATFEVVQMIVGLLYLGPDGEVAKSTEEQSEEFCKLALRFSINEFAKGLLHDLEVGGITTQLAPWALVEAVRKDDDLLAMMLIEYMERNGGKRQLLNAPAFLKLRSSDIQWIDHRCVFLFLSSLVFMFISTTMSQEFDATTTELLCALIKSQAATTAPHGLPVCVRFLYNLHRDFQIPRLVKVLDFSCREKLGSQLQSYGVVKFLEQHIDPTLVTIYEVIAELFA
ncbi:hypothetical protein M3Y96_00520000 [Aphelenchoides besseyi]|nr:hypothetical protein M3Y96_00520000 [Aphelenchoides besseyi]